MAQAYVKGRIAQHLEDLEQADFVIVATPLNAETRGLIDSEAFASMKQGALLINVARGPIVDRNALRAAQVAMPQENATTLMELIGIRIAQTIGASSPAAAMLSPMTL